MTTTRRDFMRHTIGGASLLASGMTLPGFLSATAAATTNRRVDSILVVIQLTGGNDGLNTVIPYRDDAYHRARPSLRVNEDNVLDLNDSLGLHPELDGFKRLYDDGLLNVINNVGYPNPDRSHFRSMDIWHTAATTPEGVEDGWLGRVVDAEQSALEHETPMALHLASGALPRALRTRTHVVPSVSSINAFRLDDEDGHMERAIAAARDLAHDDLLFVQRIALSSCQSARQLEAVRGNDPSSIQYPGLGLAERLKQISQLITADYGARVYYTSLGGFDTHSRQSLTHPRLLRELGTSVDAFMKDLESQGLADRVVVVTFSEFGRRVRENSSAGTDHGAGAPMFVIGKPCKAGVTGKAPDLENLVEGDVPHDIDFRRVYATLLERWLNVDSRAILGSRFEMLDLV